VEHERDSSTGHRFGGLLERDVRGEPRVAALHGTLTTLTEKIHCPCRGEHLLDASLTKLKGGELDENRKNTEEKESKSVHECRTKGWLGK